MQAGKAPGRADRGRRPAAPTRFWERRDQVHEPRGGLAVDLPQQRLLPQGCAKMREGEGGWVGGTGGQAGGQGRRREERQPAGALQPQIQNSTCIACLGGSGRPCHGQSLT